MKDVRSRQSRRGATCRSHCPPRLDRSERRAGGLRTAQPTGIGRTAFGRPHVLSLRLRHGIRPELDSHGVWAERNGLASTDLRSSRRRHASSTTKPPRASSASTAWQLSGRTGTGTGAANRACRSRAQGRARTRRDRAGTDASPAPPRHVGAATERQCLVRQVSEPERTGGRQADAKRLRANPRRAAAVAQMAARAGQGDGQGKSVRLCLRTDCRWATWSTTCATCASA
jgi:hypothetical protein